MQCPKCSLRYNNSTRLPLLMPCSHTICQQCLPNILSCLTCKRIISNEYKNITQSRKQHINYSLLQLIQNNPQQIDKFIKVCFVGSSGTGKTSIIRMLKGHNFVNQLASTIGFDFVFEDRTVGQYRVRYQLWDSAGQEKYRAVSPLHYKNAQIIVLVYDVSQHNKNYLSDWITEIQHHSPPQSKWIIIGNKMDLFQGKVGKLLSHKDWQLIKHHSHNTNHIHVSCRMGEGKELIWENFDQCFKRIIKNSHSQQSSSLLSYSFNIENFNKKQKKRCC